MAKKHSFPPNLLAFGMLCSSRAPAASNAGRMHSDSSAANSPRDTARFPVESGLFIGELLIKTWLISTSMLEGNG